MMSLQSYFSCCDGFGRHRVFCKHSEIQSIMFRIGRTNYDIKGSVDALEIAFYQEESFPMFRPLEPSVGLKGWNVQIGYIGLTQFFMSLFAMAIPIIVVSDTKIWKGKIMLAACPGSCLEDVGTAMFQGVSELVQASE